MMKNDVTMPDREPIDWQEMVPGYATIPVTVTISKATKRTATVARRRWLDARLWHSLAVHKDGRSWHGCEAAEAIVRGYALNADGPPVKAHSWEIRSPSHKSHEFTNDADRRCDKLYWKWGDEMPAHGLNRHAAMMILVDGYSCRYVARALRRHHSWATRNLIRGLQLYCDLSGWPR